MVLGSFSKHYGQDRFWTRIRGKFSFKKKVRQELISEPLPIDISVHLVCFHLVHPFVNPDNPFTTLWNLCSGRETRFQQDHSPALLYRSPQGMGISLRAGFTFPRRFPLHLPMGW